MTLPKTGSTFSTIYSPPDDRDLATDYEVAGLMWLHSRSLDIERGIMGNLLQRHRLPVRGMLSHSALNKVGTVILCLTGPLLGCGGGSDAGTGPNDDIYVTYDLESIDGDPVPSVLFQGHDDQVDEDFLHEIVTGYMRLDRDNTIKSVLVQRVSFGPFGATTSIPEQGEGNLGSFTRSGNTLVLTRGDGSISNLTLSDNGRAITEVKTLPVGLPGAATDVQFAFFYAR